MSRPKPPEAEAEGQPLQGFAHRRPSPGEIEGPRGCPSAAPFFDPRRRPVVVGMRPHVHRFGRVRSGTRDAHHRSPRRRRSASWSFRARQRPASGAFSFGRGLDFPPFLIRSEASLYEAQAEGLHARIRRSSGNSQPLCLIREARRPGTEGAGPILAAACCSHSPARRPAHLGGFSGSVWISFPCLIHETLNRASQRALAPRLTRRPGARPRE